MIPLITWLLMILLALLSLAAVILVIVAASTVGIAGFLAFSDVQEGVRIRARPYRRWFIVILLAALLVCLALALRVAGQLGPEQTVVTIAVDSGMNYLSTELYSGA